MKQFDVLSVGDALIDAFLSIHDAQAHCRVDEKTNELCVPYGEKIMLDGSEFLLGGNACNVAVGLSRLGLRTALCAEIGNDGFSQKVTQGLTKEHVDQSLLIQTPGAQSSFAIGINFKNERTLFVEHVKRKHDFLFPSTKVGWVYLSSLGQEWKQAYEKTYAFVKAEKAKLAFNPGTPQLHEKEDGIANVLAITDILFVNKEEGIKIANGKWHVADGKAATKSLLEKLQTLGPKIVVVTDGKRGSYVLDEEKQFYHLGIFDHPVVERTGAGDAYTSGFLSAMIHKRPIEEAMRWGTCNAGSVVGKVGAQQGLLYREDMLRELASAKNLLT